MTENFKIPDTSKIPILPVTTVRNSKALQTTELAKQLEKHVAVGDTNKPLGVFVQYDRIKTKRKGDVMFGF